MMKRLLIIPLLILFAISTMAQEAAKNLQRADKAYNDLNYKKALDFYLKAASEKSVNAYLARQVGNCYRLLGDYSQAAVWYENAVNQVDHTDFDYLLLSYAQKATGNDELAAISLKKVYDPKGYTGQNNSFAINLRNSYYNFNIFPTVLSSPEADFSPAFYRDAVVYTTSIFDRDLINYQKINPQQHLNLFTAKLSNNGELGKPYFFSVDLLSQYYTGPIAFSPTFDTAYFVRKKYLLVNFGDEKQMAKNNLKIHRAVFSLGKWVDQGPVSFCSEKYSVSDPAVSPDGKRIYYTSDIPGGVGGIDIYYRSILPNGSFGEAISLGVKINTPGNETTPFVAKDGSLFFSSDTHPGFGSTDLFVAQPTPTGFDLVTNLGYPINGPYDDFGFAINTAMNMAFFSSNRPDGVGDDDIYKVIVEKKSTFHNVAGQVLDENGSPLASSTVKVYTDNNLINTLLTDINGKFTCKIDGNLEATIVADLIGFFQTKSTLSTFGLGLKPTDIKVTITLKKDAGYTLIGTVLSAADGSQLNNAQVIAYPPDTSRAIIGITDQLGRFSIKLNPETDYRVKITRDGFVGKSVSVSTKNRDRGEINLTSLFDTKLTPEVKPGITGKLTDATSALPLSNAIITIKSLAFPQGQKFASNDAGTFSITNLTEGDYIIKIEKEGYKPINLNVTVGKELLNLNSINTLAMEPATTSITAVGFVTSKEDNSPLMDVSLTLLNKTTNEKVQGHTDEFGSFDFKVDPDKIYLLKLEKEKFFTKTLLFPTQGVQPGMLNLNQTFDLKMEAIVMNKAIEIPNIYYDLGKSNIKPEAAQELDKVVKLLAENPTIQIELSSHTDSRGDSKQNQILSQKRAESAVKYIVSKGIQPSRIVAKGYGDTMIKNHCTKGVKCSEDEHAVNRRTEIKVIKF